MKLFIPILCCFSLLFADWQDDWAAGRSASHHKDFGKAIELYNKAIEAAPNHAGPQSDLGQAYYLMKDFNKALVELAKVDTCTDGKTLEIEQRVRFCTAMIYANLNELDQFQKYWNEFLENDPNLPTIEHTEEYIYIFNAPNNKCFRNFMENVLKATDEIESFKWEGSTGIGKKSS